MKKETTLYLKKLIKEEYKKLLNEEHKKIIVTKGETIGGYTSNGNHYVYLYPNKWELYAETNKLLTKGKIKSDKDSDYILNKGNVS